MPRQARLDAPGALHHVMIRGIEGTAIFRNQEDREDFLARMGQDGYERDGTLLTRLNYPRRKSSTFSSSPYF